MHCERSGAPHVGNHAFFSGLAGTKIEGKTAVRAKGAGVLLVMLMQCCRDYPALPDPRTLDVWEIRSFYKFLIPELTRNGR